MSQIILKFTNSVLFLLCMAFSLPALADNWKMKLDLSGAWKFSIGDNEQWADPEFDDRNWESIQVPSPWESQGFHGYDG